MTGHIRYSQPWIHFARRLDEYVLYVIREGSMYLRENGLEYHLKAGDFFLLEPGLQHVGTRKASCDYFYTHFTHPELRRVEDGAAAMAELAEKRRQSLISYNLDAADPTDSVTYLPKHFHLSGGEHRSLLRSAVACYEAREEHYKRRASTFLHSFLLQTAHEPSHGRDGRSGPPPQPLRGRRGPARAVSQPKLHQESSRAARYRSALR